MDDEVSRIKKKMAAKFLDEQNKPAQVIFNTSESTFAADVLTKSKTVPVIVDFWAPWCGPCRALGPAIERIVNSYGGKVLLAKLNVDQNPGLARRYGVMGIPSVKLFRNGSVADEFVGLIPEEAIKQFVDRNL